MASRILSCASASGRQGLSGSTARLGMRFPAQRLWLQPGQKRAIQLASRPARRSSSSSLFYCMAAPLAAVSLDDRQAAEPPRQARRPPPGYNLPLNPKFAAQVAKGSFAGFVAGLLVSMFSQTLVFFLGLAFTFQTLAAKLGIDLAHYLKLKERVTSSKILAALAENTAFKLSFGTSFMLAAFAHF